MERYRAHKDTIAVAIKGLFVTACWNLSLYEKEQKSVTKCLWRNSSRHHWYSSLFGKPRSLASVEWPKDPGVCGTGSRLSASFSTGERTDGPGPVAAGHSHGMLRNVQCRHLGRAPLHFVFRRRLVNFSNHPQKKVMDEHTRQDMLVGFDAYDQLSDARLLVDSAYQRRH